MAFWVYILECADGRYYTGHTDDLERRMAQHQAGGYCDFTTRRRPVRLIWAEALPSRIEALESEMRVKKWSRAKKQALAAGDWDRLSVHAMPPREREARLRGRVSTTLDTNGGGATEPRSPTP